VPSYPERWGIRDSVIREELMAEAIYQSLTGKKFPP